MKLLSVQFGLRSIYQYRDLLKSLVKREIEAKYRASLLGRLWVVIFPLMMLGVYTFVFGNVFGARWAGKGDLTDYVPMLYSGMIVHAMFAETVGKAPYLIINNPNYVKKIVFPLELLPVSSLVTALFNGLISFVLLLLMVFLFKKQVHWTAVTGPLVLLPLFFYAIGFAWLIAALGVFFRDLEQIIGVLMSMLLFLSPVFYSAESAPELARNLLMFNPLTYPIEEFRRVVLLGLLPQWSSWFLNLVIALAVAWSGLWVFERTKPAFADVI